MAFLVGIIRGILKLFKPVDTDFFHFQVLVGVITSFFAKNIPTKMRKMAI